MAAESQSRGLDPKVCTTFMLICTAALFEWPTCMYMPRVIDIKAADFAPELARRFFNIRVYCQ